MSKLKIPLRKNGALNTLLLKKIESELIEATTSLPSESPLSQRAYHVYFNIEKVPQCLCERPRKFKGFRKGYAATCGKCNSQSEITKQTLMANHGVTNTFQLEKTKIKIRNTMIERYGVEHGFQCSEIRNKSKQTNLERRGVEYPTQSSDVIKTRQDNNLMKYGVKEPSSLPEIQAKCKQTNLERRGVEYPSQSLAHKKLSKISRNETENVLRPNRQLFDTKEKCMSQYKELCNLFSLSQKYDVGHTWLSRTFKKFQIPIVSFTSHVQQEVFDFVTSLSMNPKNNDRTQIYPHEIDIFIESKKVGIEINGVYWHSFDEIETKEERERHSNKLKKCESVGIKLIQITDHEWKTKNEKIKSLICSVLGIYERKIMARKCNVEHISVQQANEFLAANHLQGTASSSVRLGLFYFNQLIGVATFQKPRFNRKFDWEIIRLCFLKNTLVHGGTAKLITAFLHDYGDSLVSYVDRDKFSGESLSRLQFKKISELTPTYYYINGDEILSRNKCQKHKLIKLLTNFDSNISEAQNCFNNGFRRYWSSGNDVWVKFKEKTNV